MHTHSSVKHYKPWPISSGSLLIPYFSLFFQFVPCFIILNSCDKEQSLACKGVVHAGEIYIYLLASPWVIAAWGSVSAFGGQLLQLKAPFGHQQVHLIVDEVFLPLCDVYLSTTEGMQLLLIGDEVVWWLTAVVPISRSQEGYSFPPMPSGLASRGETDRKVVEIAYNGSSCVAP